MGNRIGNPCLAFGAPELSRREHFQSALRVRVIGQAFGRGVTLRVRLEDPDFLGL
jgi:hypothetical protein